MEAVARMEEGLNGEGKSVRDSPVPAKRKTADDDEKDSEMTLNTYLPRVFVLSPEALKHSTRCRLLMPGGAR